MCDSHSWRVRRQRRHSATGAVLAIAATASTDLRPLLKTPNQRLTRRGQRPECECPEHEQQLALGGLYFPSVSAPTMTRGVLAAGFQRFGWLEFIYFARRPTDWPSSLKTCDSLALLILHILATAAGSADGLRLSLGLRRTAKKGGDPVKEPPLLDVQARCWTCSALWASRRGPSACSLDCIARSPGSSARPI